MHDTALYDTSVVIDVEDVDLGVYVDAAVVVSAVTIGELAYGARCRRSRRSRARACAAVLADYEVAPFGVEEAKLYGVLAELVRIAGRSPRPRRLDLQIAATAAASTYPAADHEPGRLHRHRAGLVDVVPIRRAS